MPPIDKLDMKKVATILCGIGNCGGGFVIIGGKIVKIPPRGPSYERIQAAIQVVLKEANALAARKG